MNHALMRARLAIARDDTVTAQALLDAVPEPSELGWLGLDRALLGAEVALARRRASAAAQAAARVRQRIEQAGLAQYLPLQLAESDLIAGEAELDEGHGDAAKKLLRSALDLREQALLPDSPLISQARKALGEAR